MVEIRKLSIADYDKMIQVWKDSDLPYRPDGRDSRATIAEYMLLHNDLVLGAFEGEKLVGVVIGAFDGRNGHINRLAVSSKKRRVGVGKALLAECEKALKARGAEVISTLVEVPNHPSVELFKRAGYVHHEDIIYLSKRDRPEA